MFFPLFYSQRRCQRYTIPENCFMQVMNDPGKNFLILFRNIFKKFPCKNLHLGTNILKQSLANRRQLDADGSPVIHASFTNKDSIADHGFNQYGSCRQSHINSFREDFQGNTLFMILCEMGHCNQGLLLPGGQRHQ